MQGRRAARKRFRAGRIAAPVQRLRAPLIVATAVFVALAGCSEAPTPDAADPKPGEATINVIDTGLVCGGFCEPSVAVDDAGWTYVYSQGAVARSADGRAFEPFERPPLPDTVRLLFPNAFQTDNLLQTGPDGTLWFSALVAVFDPSLAAIVLLGVQVASSSDHGDSWRTDAFLQPFEGQQAMSLGADRQWLGLGADGDALVVFQRIPPVFSFTGALPSVTVLPGIWASHSDDGRSFTPFVEVTPGAGPGAVYIVGPPWVDAGSVRVPFHWYPGDGRAAAAAFSTSTDDGATWTTTAVGPAGDFFPQIVGGGTSLHFVMRLDATLFVASSVDGGATWGEPVPLGPAGAMVSSPWAGVRDGGLEVAWLAPDEATDDAYTLHWTTRGPAGVSDRIISRGVGGSLGVRANTDFAHFTYRDGEPLLVLGDAFMESVSLYEIHDRRDG